MKLMQTNGENYKQIMNNLFVTDEHFIALKQRGLEFTEYINTCNDLPSNIDRNLIKVINQLNNLPGIVTVFSCEGHVNSKNTNGRYLEIILAVTSVGYESLVNLYNRLFDRLPFAQKLLLFIKHNHLLSPINFEFYNAITLGFQNGYLGDTHEVEKLMFISTLEQVLARTLTKLN